MPVDDRQTSIDPISRQALVDVSVRIGSDPLFVQGGGGNSSLKSAVTLSVKASGFWLRDAATTSMFVDLDLSKARQLAKSGATSYESAVYPEIRGRLRPSIETGLHALMPHRVVLHVHCANVIAASITPSVAATLPQLLDSLRWTMLDYVTPGAALATALEAAQAVAPCDIVLLRNHGIVAGGDSAEEAEATLRSVARRINLPRATFKEVTSPTDPAATGYRWLGKGMASGLARDPERALALTYGALVPDQVVYLGGAACLIDHLGDLPELAARWMTERGVSPSLVFVAERGALVREDLTEGGLSMVELLCEIALRLPKGERPSTLSLGEELVLLSWEAEKFRQAVDRDRA